LPLPGFIIFRYAFINKNWFYLHEKDINCKLFIQKKAVTSIGICADLDKRHQIDLIGLDKEEQLLQVKQDLLTIIPMEEVSKEFDSTFKVSKISCFMCEPHLGYIQHLRNR